MAQTQILDVLLDKDEITWKALLMDLVKREDMDPWDIDISSLTKSYLGTVKELKKFDFKVSGKVLLAAALLLKFKSNYLLKEEIAQFDSIISGQDEEDLYEHHQEETDTRMPLDEEKARLIPRTPQPRQRKVSIYDLIDALHEALEVQKRRTVRQRVAPAPDVSVPEKTIDIDHAMETLFARIEEYFTSPLATTLKFSEIVPGQEKDHKVYTFIPLLHLINQGRVDVHQERHFEDFNILLPEA